MPNTSDIAIPEMKLIQNVGGEEAKGYGAKPGQFYCAITQEIIPEEGFDVVIVQPPSKNRTYWGRDTMEDEPPVCASMDGTTSINGDICEKACPYKAFNDAPYMLSATERRLKCTANYNVLAIKTGDMMPVLIRCGGISAQAAKELNSLLMFHKALRGGMSFRAQIRVSSVKKKTASGEAYAIKFGNPVLIDDQALLTEVKTQFAALAGVSMAEITMPTETEKAETVTEKPVDIVKAAVNQAEVIKTNAQVMSQKDVDDLFDKKAPPPDMKTKTTVAPPVTKTKIEF